MRKLLTPGVRVNPLCATSANPSATGIIPGSPKPGEEQLSNNPEQSAKLITIDGVPAAPKALGAANKPWVNCSKLTGPATNDADTAAYSTLHPPLANATTSPHSVDGPE